MAKKKSNNVSKTIDPKKLKIGDVVEIEWYDVHAYERIEFDEIDELDEPESTKCWGVVVRKTDNYLFIASELGDRESDGAWLEALPLNIISRCKKLDNIKIK